LSFLGFQPFTHTAEINPLSGPLPSITTRFIRRAVPDGYFVSAIKRGDILNTAMTKPVSTESTVTVGPPIVLSVNIS